MIKVECHPEPEDFDEKVRQKGLKFLAEAKKLGIKPTQEWNKGKHCYWTAIREQLETLHGAVCVYSSLWLLPANGTVDHYTPKSHNHALAYEWENFRLASKEINQCKGTHTDILDPFAIEDEWFIFDTDTFRPKPNPALSEEIKEMISTTIKKLKLNDKRYTEVRKVWIKAFGKNLNELKKHSPFLASELQRQFPNREELIEYVEKVENQEKDRLQKENQLKSNKPIRK